MKIEAPCRLGERFDCRKPYSNGRFILTGLTFFYWESSLFPGTTLCGKRDAQNRLENSTFFEPGDAESSVRISFEVPDAIVIPGYPLSELGLDTRAVGHLAGLSPDGGGLGLVRGIRQGLWRAHGAGPDGGAGPDV